MSVIGIDFGNDNCYIACARAGGIDTLDNDYSLRATPSCVAFGEKQRLMGVPAKNAMVTNIKNTIFDFKRLLGRQYEDPLVKDEIPNLPYRVMPLANGEVGVEVNYQNSIQIFSIEQIVGMLFTKLKELSEVAINAKVHDCVVSVPTHFTDIQRRALLNAVSIGGFNCLRLMNDSAATALSYGIYRAADLPGPEEKPRHVFFIDFGHSSFQTYAVAFHKTKLKIITCSSDPDIGGRYFDQLLVDHFIEEFKVKYNIDARSSNRSICRLNTEIEKLKKQMSANSTNLPLNIECFFEEKDVSSSMNRNTFESLSKDILERIECTLFRCLLDSKIPVEEFHSVEIVGGSTRIPYVKTLIEKIFKKTPSTTLNQDEAVSRGCALQCAMLSPTFKVKEFCITDVQQYPIRLYWDESKGQDGSTEVFPRFHQIPQLRMLSFYRKEPMTLKVKYDSDIPFLHKDLGTFKINGIKPTNEGENSKIKVKARVNIHGIFNIEGASLYEKVDLPVEEKMETENPETTNQTENPCGEQIEESTVEGSDPKDSEGKSEEQAHTSTEQPNASNSTGSEDTKSKVKKQHYKTTDLPIESFNFGLGREEVNSLYELEGQMIAQDRLEKERIDAKNALEEYVYDLREKLDVDLYQYVMDDDRQRHLEMLNQLENWLYDEGSDKTKPIYIQKLDDLKKIGEPVKTRKREYDDIPRFLQELEHSCQLANKQLNLIREKDPKYDHLERDEIEKIAQSVQDSEMYLGNARASFVNSKKTADPAVRANDIHQRKKNMEAIILPIINKPKPKVEPPKVDSDQKGENDASKNSEHMEVE